MESSQEKARSDTGDNRTTNLWWSAASIIGSGIAVMCLGSVSWSKTFEVSSLIMGATCLLFILGIFWYYPEEKPPGSPLTAIYRVFRAAIKKRKLSYPSSEQGYNNEGSKDSEDSLYERENDKVLLLPRDPSFLSFLDKAAIKNANEEQACTAEQVRDVKSLYAIMPLGLIFSMYIVVSASGNTYFILQTSNLDSRVGSLNFPTMVFFVLRSLIAFGVRTIQSRYKLKSPLCSMAVGMFCSGLCCIAAWQVERRRLSLVKFLEKPDDDIPMSIMILIPQYFLLGLMKEFGEGGLQTFLRDRVHSEPMKKFVGPCIEMLMGIGKWFSILLALIFHRWIKDSINHSRLDKYFLVLALLSFVYLGIYVLYAKFKLQKPLVIPETSEGINVVCYQLSCEVNSV
ncbi:protein NRT1/ PTR FAMILY 5.5-like [Neltuma alba]|uniref:protein NRT1/ PTR FAMILY 5.5-like n=1 Tax=Neltuma alba TaxID=207710 RepID=UPI0010A3E05C|nr:protein NRT1/ PTR FAMILY 5.5-like [Prosopis alba]